MNQSNNIDSLNQFLDKFQTAKNYNTKEIRLTINDAEQLSIGISRLLVRQSNLSDQLVEVQNQLLKITNELLEIHKQKSTDITLEVSQDGGKF